MFADTPRVYLVLIDIFQQPANILVLFTTRVREHMPTPARTDRLPQPHLRAFIILVLSIVVIAFGVYINPLSISLSPSSTDSLPPMATTTTTERDMNAVKNMSPALFRRWNKLADGMTMFHEKFEWEFNTVYDVSGGPRESLAWLEM